jgi:carbonic anhydrase
VQYPDQVSLAMNITFDNFGRGLEARKFPSDFEVEYEDSEYQLLQFHFHWYSEHKLFDRNTSLEVHFVHRNEDEKLLVIGMLFEITDKTNYFLDEVLSSYGRPLRKTELRRFVSDSLSRGFFSYNGSLTTPPCTEGVTWIVSPRVQDMSLAQLRRINALMTRNNRPTL